MSRKCIFSLIIFCLMAGCLVAQTFHTADAKAPKAGTMFISPERISLKAGGMLTIERGMIFVPVNRSRANSDVIAIEVYRFKRSDKSDPHVSPIFFLHGGPSFAGLERSLEVVGTFEDQWQDLTDVSDVVIVSQRGIGPSKPTTTIETTGKSLAPDQAYNDEDAVAEYQKTLAREKAAWEDLGLDLKGFTVIEAAADVNDVRKALGYDKIVIWGGSFGSHWGMTVMRYHPEIVERAILRGMEGPDHTYDHPGHIWNVFKRVAEEAENSPELKGLIPEGGLIKAIESVVKKVESNPFTVTVIDPDSKKKQDVLIDGHVVKNLARGNSGNLAAWPASVITLLNGDFREAAERALLRYNNPQRNFNTASFWMLDSGSGITAERLAIFEADPAQKIIGSTYWAYAAGSPVWESDLGDEFRQNFETEIPTVIVHGTWDTSTPFENALELVPYFKNSKFIPLERGPHGAIRAALEVNEQFKKGIYKFAASGDMSGLPDKMEMPKVKWVIPDVKRND
ncbi:alpha/beta fold hydrolase [Acidobacteriota bacterium]